MSDDMKVMTSAEAIEFLSANLQDETSRSEAYRDACISLIDLMVENSVLDDRKARTAKAQDAVKLMRMAPVSGATN